MSKWWKKLFDQTDEEEMTVRREDDEEWLGQESNEVRVSETKKMEKEAASGSFEKAENLPTLEDLKRILEEVIRETKREVIKITTTPFANGSLTGSRFGGLPYIPRGGEIPTTADGKQLQFLAQINCAELPANRIYPMHGMLQFWIFSDDLMGADFDDVLQDDTKRVLYYPSIDSHWTEEELKEKYQPFDPDEECFSPFGKGTPFGLSFQREEEGISPSDFRFEEVFLEKWNRRFPNRQTDSLYGDNFPDEFGEYIYDECYSSGHKIGGYPFFTQTDPREYENAEYTVLLLQIDSDYSKECT